jgi:predicted metal-dependent phosphoesterase TrpH
LIDLHTHTTASDGRLPPAALVHRAVEAGVSVLGVTDHDTVAGGEEAEAACRKAGLTFVPGIEITSVREAVDVHILGYFIDRQSPALQQFLAQQRSRRVDRVRDIVARLATLGMPLDADAILQPAYDDPRRSAGRPWVARALIAEGHAQTTSEAFERWLGRGRPAFIPRLAADPAEVIERIHDVGGIASIAHPGLLKRDDWLRGFVDAGADALEAYHTEHDDATTARYLDMARRFNVAVSGGSDFHGDESHGASSPGTVLLPQEEFDRLVRLATIRATASGSPTSS